jgi:hypothetical protein
MARAHQPVDQLAADESAAARHAHQLRAAGQHSVNLNVDATRFRRSLCRDDNF